MKYGIWLDEWFRNYIQPSSKIKTCERYSEIIEKHLKVKLGEYELDELTPLVLQRYVTELLRSGNIVTGKGLAANSVNGIITVIQNSLKLAYTLGELKEYTADKIKRPKTKEKEVSCFTLPEQKKIEQAVLTSKKPKLFGIVLCLYSGLRIGELLALEWSAFCSLTLVLPYEIANLDLIEKSYDEVIMPNDYKCHYKAAIEKRNRWLAENCDLMIIYIERENGGAYKCYKYARELGVQIVNIADKIHNEKQ